MPGANNTNNSPRKQTEREDDEQSVATSNAEEIMELTDEDLANVSDKDLQVITLFFLCNFSADLKAQE